MKPFLLLLITMLFIATTHAQQLPQAEQPTREYYLKKAKRQKITGIVMLAGGGALFAICASQSVNHLMENTPVYDAGAAIGLASALGSIPVFIAAGRNKKKARAIETSIIIKPELNNLSRYTGRTNAYPALGLQMIF